MQKRRAIDTRRLTLLLLAAMCGCAKAPLSAAGNGTGAPPVSGGSAPRTSADTMRVTGSSSTGPQILTRSAAAGSDASGTLLDGAGGVVAPTPPKAPAEQPDQPAVAGMPATAGMPAPTATTPATAGAMAPWQPGMPCPQTVTCGGEVCSTEGMTGGAADSPNSCLAACCSSNQKCGVSVLTSLTENGSPQCTELNQPGVVSAECGAPAEMDGMMGPQPNPDDPLGFDVTFCCRTDNRCGIFLPNIGSGCTAFEDIKTVSPLFEAIDIPPQSCHYAGTE